MKKNVSFEVIDGFTERLAEFFRKNMDKDEYKKIFIAVIGDLGTGKTTFVKKLSKGIGIKEEVKSPTFTLIQEYYSGLVPLYHFDVYRIGGNPMEIYEIGYEEYIEKDGIVVVEWADLIESELPEEYIKISFKYSEDTMRWFELDYIGNDMKKEEILKNVYTGD